MSEDVACSLAAYFWYSSGVGSLPSMAEIEASSAEARKTLAPLPRRFGKFRVEVDTTVDLSATRAWFPVMDREGKGREGKGREGKGREGKKSRRKIVELAAE